jgi:hypothetical protein
VCGSRSIRDWITAGKTKELDHDDRNDRVVPKKGQQTKLIERHTFQRTLGKKRVRMMNNFKKMATPRQLLQERSSAFFILFAILITVTTAAATVQGRCAAVAASPILSNNNVHRCLVAASDVVSNPCRRHALLQRRLHPQLVLPAYRGGGGAAGGSSKISTRAQRLVHAQQGNGERGSLSKTENASVPTCTL